MDKVLGIIVAASVIVLIAAVIIPSLTGTLGSTGKTSDNLQEDSACNFRVERAQEQKNPDMVGERCVDYIDDPAFKTQAEQEEVSCILTNTC
jgi:hypothetical protein